jgi:hypothetical protein
MQKKQCNNFYSSDFGGLGRFYVGLIIMFHDIKFRSLKNSRKIARKCFGSNARPFHYAQIQVSNATASIRRSARSIFRASLSALMCFFLGVLGGELGAVGARSRCG